MFSCGLLYNRTRFLFYISVPSRAWGVCFFWLSCLGSFPLKDNACVEGEVGALKLDVNTFFGDRELAALGDLDRLDGLVAAGRLGVLNLLDNLVALENLAEDDVLAIEPAVGRWC